MRHGILAMLLFTACANDLDSADHVHDLRLLAIRTEPPAQSLAVTFLADGGVTTELPPAACPDGGPLLCDGGVPILPLIAPITLTGLVADPDGGGRAISYTFATCAAFDTTTSQCDDGSPGFQTLGSGTVTADDLGAEPSFTWTPDYATLAGVFQNDPLQGFDGLQVPVQLQISAGGTTIVGVKRFVINAGPFAALPPNQNPGLSDLQIGGTSWGPDVVGNLIGTSGPKTGEVDGGVDVLPIPDASLVETYVQPQLGGGSQVLTEEWRYFYYATAGTFSPATTGGGSLFTSDAGVDSTWQLTDSDVNGPASVWIVITDGRGGETWVARRAILTIVPIP
jgi:hypothetical protein